MDESSVVGVDKESSGQHHSMQGGSLTTAKLADKLPHDAVKGGLPPHGSTPAVSRASSKEKHGKYSKDKSINIASGDKSSSRARTHSKASVTQEKVINKGPSNVEVQGNQDYNF